MAMMIALDRRIPDAVASLRAGKWERAEYGKAEGIYGKTLGIAGLGAIGREVAARAKAFGLHVVGLEPVAHAGEGERPRDRVRADDRSAGDALEHPDGAPAAHRADAADHRQARLRAAAEAGDVPQPGTRRSRRLRRAPRGGEDARAAGGGRRLPGRAARDEDVRERSRSRSSRRRAASSTGRRTSRHRPTRRSSRSRRRRCASSARSSSRGSCRTW